MIMADRKRSEDNPVVIKKYANRRLYNTESSTYVTLDDLCQMVKRGEDFVVYDAKTGDDITRSVLTQIIFEQESRGYNLLPVNFLRRIIGFYDSSMKEILPPYLEASLDAFTRNQEQMRSMFANSLNNLFPYNQLEELGKQNLALMQKAFSMFSPFEYFAGQGAEDPAEKTPRGDDTSKKKAG